jgi:hypothetical protein
MSLPVAGARIVLTPMPPTYFGAGTIDTVAGTQPQAGHCGDSSGG